MGGRVEGEERRCAGPWAGGVAGAATTGPLGITVPAGRGHCGKSGGVRVLGRVRLGGLAPHRGQEWPRLRPPAAGRAAGCGTLGGHGGGSCHNPTVRYNGPCRKSGEVRFLRWVALPEMRFAIRGLHGRVVACHPIRRVPNTHLIDLLSNKGIISQNTLSILHGTFFAKIAGMPDATRDRVHRLTKTHRLVLLLAAILSLIFPLIALIYVMTRG